MMFVCFFIEICDYYFYFFIFNSFMNSLLLFNFFKLINYFIPSSRASWILFHEQVDYQIGKDWIARHKLINK